MTEQFGLEAMLSVYDDGFTRGLKNAEQRIESFDKRVESLSTNMSTSLSGGMTSFSNSVSDMSSSLTNMTSALSDGVMTLGNNIHNIGDRLTNSITKPALAAAGALSALTIGKGFGRLVGIDSARAKLQGLGHDVAAVDAIMDNALASVSGTSHAMEDAANTAATAVAAGIAPGKELTRYLTLVGDAAAIAGIGMGEMGSIFSKIATSGVIQAEEMNQLGDRGIPIFQMLGDAMNVSATEVKALGSQGAISSDIFLRAIEEGFGGAAKTMGDMSFSASLQNIGAAVSRIGANFLDAGGDGEGFFSQLKPLMSEFRENLGSIEDRAAELGIVFGQSFGKLVEDVRSAISWYKALDDATQNLIKRTVGIGSAVAVGIGPAMKIVGALTTGLATISVLSSSVLGGLSGGLSKGTSLLTTLGSGFTTLGSKATSGVSTATAGIGGLISKMVALKGSMNFGGIEIPTFPKESDVPQSSSGSNLDDALKSIKGIDEVYSKRLVDNFGSDGNFFDNLRKYMDSSDTDKIKVPDKLIQSVIDSEESIEGLTKSVVTLGDTTERSGNRFTSLFDNLVNDAAQAGSALSSFGSSALVFASSIGGALKNVAEVTIVALQLMMKASMGAFNIAAMTGVVLVGMGLFYSKFQTDIDKFIDQVIQRGPALVSGLAGSIVSRIPELVTSGSQLFSKLIDVIVKLGPSIAQAGMDIVTALVSGVLENMDVITNGLAQLFLFITTIIGENLPTIIIMGTEVLLAFMNGLLDNQDMLQEGINALLNGLLLVLTEGMPLFFEIGAILLTFLANGIADNTELITKIAILTITLLANLIIENLDLIINTGLYILESLYQGILDNWDVIEEAGTSIVDTLAIFLQQQAPALIERGLELVLWIADGIVDNLGPMMSAALNIAGTLIGSLSKGIYDNRAELGHLTDMIAFTLVGGLTQALLNGMVGLGEWFIGLFTGDNAPTFERFDFMDDIDQYEQNSRKRYGLDVQYSDDTKRGPGRGAESNRGTGRTPANISLNLGGRDYDAFSGDIYDNNELNIRMRENY